VLPLKDFRTGGGEMGSIYVVGTCDTKGQELGFIRDLIAGKGQPVKLVDVSTTGSSHGTVVDHAPAEVLSHHPAGGQLTGDRGESVTAMSEALTRFIATRDDVDGMIGIGGSGGTALIAPAMRVLAIGVPKVLVSTVASGNVAPYVGPTDISMMYSVTDVAGLNRISRKVLSNAAFSVLGMVANRIADDAASKPAVGLTMFGVTTPCVQAIVAGLERDYDCLVFHATGTGGQSFEKLVDSGLVTAGLDITTTEVCDLLVGGVFPATEDRFGAFERSGLPWIGSVGAMDMVNFGAMSTVPERFRDRKLHVHNAQVTLMRTTAEENVRFGEWMGERLNRCNGPVRLLLPQLGVSALDKEGAPFFDPEADEALFTALERTIRPAANRSVERLPLHINDPEFAQIIIRTLKDVQTNV
jgi:uncharacterized protein (UPF0261 family)